jgi:hypothetical protein
MDWLTLKALGEELGLRVVGLGECLGEALELTDEFTDGTKALGEELGLTDRLTTEGEALDEEL